MRHTGLKAVLMRIAMLFLYRHVRYNSSMKSGGLGATRRSLVERLADWGDQVRWQEFFDTYSKLIYSAARQSGLTDTEAQEVVQETIITVAKSRSEEHTSELQSHSDLVCRLL